MPWCFKTKTGTSHSHTSMNHRHNNTLPQHDAWGRPNHHKKKPPHKKSIVYTLACHYTHICSKHICMPTCQAPHTQAKHNVSYTHPNWYAYDGSGSCDAWRPCSSPRAACAGCACCWLGLGARLCSTGVTAAGCLTSPLAVRRAARLVRCCTS